MTLLEEPHRVARKAHQCCFCLRPIRPGSEYVDQRQIFEGSPTTVRFHDACRSAYFSWVHPYDADNFYLLDDLAEGHLPPCWHAWNHDIELLRPPWTIRFIGPPPPCVCEGHRMNPGAPIFESAGRL